MEHAQGLARYFRAFLRLILTSVTPQAITTNAMNFKSVLGGGTSGLILANRLSENPNITIAVIEPGEDTRNSPHVTDPDNFLVQFDT